MTMEFLRVAQHLAEVLEQENEALKRLDFPAAAALLATKDAALAELARQPRLPAAPALLVSLMQQVSALATENQVLLERAIAVQTRIIRIVARACTPPPIAQYNEYGGQTPSHRSAAMAVSTRV